MRWVVMDATNLARLKTAGSVLSTKQLAIVLVFALTWPQANVAAHGIKQEAVLLSDKWPTLKESASSSTKTPKEQK